MVCLRSENHCAVVADTLGENDMTRDILRYHTPYSASLPFFTAGELEEHTRLFRINGVVS